MFSCASHTKTNEKKQESGIFVGDYLIVNEPNTIDDTVPRDKNNDLKFNPNIDKDSLFQVIIQDIPDTLKGNIEKMYKEGNQMTKEFFLVMFSMPKSSKKALIENYQNNSIAITELKNEYTKLVPDSLIVEIEFNPEERIVIKPASVDLKIYNINSKKRSDEWNIQYGSELLTSMLNKIGWTQDELIRIKTLLDSANCISISNGISTSIGFARSGMGKYYYSIHDNDLTNEEVEKINDGCMYIFYEKNVVLEYGSGAIGSLCFPDE